MKIWAPGWAAWAGRASGSWVPQAGSQSSKTPGAMASGQDKNQISLIGTDGEKFPDLWHIVGRVNSRALWIKSRYLPLVVVDKLHCLSTHCHWLDLIRWKPGLWGNPVLHSQRRKTSGWWKKVDILLMAPLRRYGACILMMKQWLSLTCWRYWPGMWGPSLPRHQIPRNEPTEEWKSRRL